MAINGIKKIKGSIPYRYFIIGCTIIPIAINSTLYSAILTFSQEEICNFLSPEKILIQEYVVLKIYLAFIALLGYPILKYQIKTYWEYTRKLEKRFNKIKRKSTK